MGPKIIVIPFHDKLKPSANTQCVERTLALELNPVCPLYHGTNPVKGKDTCCTSFFSISKKEIRISTFGKMSRKLLIWETVTGRAPSTGSMPKVSPSQGVKMHCQAGYKSIPCTYHFPNVFIFFCTSRHFQHTVPFSRNSFPPPFCLVNSQESLKILIPSLGVFPKPGVSLALFSYYSSLSSFVRYLPYTILNIYLLNESW